MKFSTERSTVVGEVESDTLLEAYIEDNLKRFFMKRQTNWQLKIINPEPDRLRLTFELKAHSSSDSTNVDVEASLRREVEDFIIQNHVTGRRQMAAQQLYRELSDFLEDFGDFEIYLKLIDWDDFFDLNVMVRGFFAVLSPACHFTTVKSEI